MNTRIKQRLFRITDWSERFELLNIIRRGLIWMIPVLLLSSVAQLLLYFPIDAYQDFINCSGMTVFYDSVSLFNNISTGFISLIFTLSISLSYSLSINRNDMARFGMPLASTLCFLLFVGYFSKDFNSEYLGIYGVFSSIISVILSCSIYKLVYTYSRKINVNRNSGMDRVVTGAIASVIPTACVLLFFTITYIFINKVCGVSSLQELVGIGFNKLVRIFIGNNFIMGIMTVAISQVLWFFGMHGNHMLSDIQYTYFGDLFSQNMNAVDAGTHADNIVNSVFFNTYVNIGGCGCALALLIAFLFFSRKKNAKRVSNLAAFPCLFNINEIMIFGIPVVLNPIFLIPFLFVPLINYVLAYIMTLLNIIPVISNDVYWTTPALFSGYIASGSIRGIIVQVLLLAIDVCIYIPFIRMNDEKCEEDYRKSIKKLTENLIAIEKEGGVHNFLGMDNSLGRTANQLVDELREALKKRELFLMYQPQFDRDGKCIGAEGLLRWNHPVAGFIYPPLIIALAKESGLLQEVEKIVFDDACSCVNKVDKGFKKKYKLSVNITNESLRNQLFETILEDSEKKYGIDPSELWLEITEQDALESSAYILDKMQRLKERGHKLIIDDFAMGHTSINYLQTEMFDVVKLDGSLIRNLGKNVSCQEIISSIIILGNTLGFDIVAEYVEDKDQFNSLKIMGCDLYQGYLFSKPLKLEEYLLLLE